MDTKVEKSRIFNAIAVEDNTMGIQIQARDLKKYWEIHLWLEDGQYWTALNTSEVTGPKIENKKRALFHFDQAKATYPDQELRLVQYMPRVLRLHDAGKD